MPPRVTTGRIIWAEVAHSNGIRKLRPAVIVTPIDQIVAGGKLTVVAITSQLTEPLPDDHVLLPWHPQRHVRTGLNRRCAAVCSWLATITDSDIKDVAGIVPGTVMSAILSKVKVALGSSQSPPANADRTSSEDAVGLPPPAPDR